LKQSPNRLSLRSLGLTDHIEFLSVVLNDQMTGELSQREPALNASDKPVGNDEQLPKQSEESATSVATTKSPVPSPARTLMTAIAVGLAASAIAWGVADALRVAEVVAAGTPESGAVEAPRLTPTGTLFGGAVLSTSRATQNGAVAYAILGAFLSAGLGLTAGWLGKGRDRSRLIQAGVLGLVLGGAVGAITSYALFPWYFDQMESADLTRSILIHLGIWAAIGAAAGTAFGFGLGRRNSFGQALVGGMTGAAIGTLLYDLGGAFLPLAHTERPLAELAGTRLVASLILSLCVAIGTVVVASQNPRVSTKSS
jgi:hypothetical protein